MLSGLESTTYLLGEVTTNFTMSFTIYIPFSSPGTSAFLVSFVMRFQQTCLMLIAVDTCTGNQWVHEHVIAKWISLNSLSSVGICSYLHKGLKGCPQPKASPHLKVSGFTHASPNSLSMLYLLWFTFHHKVTHANWNGSSSLPVPLGFESHRKHTSRHIVRVFPEKYNWDGKTYPEWRYHHSMGWSLRTPPPPKKRESYWKMTILYSLCFLSVDLVRPFLSHSCQDNATTMTGCAIKTSAKIASITAWLAKVSW